MRAKVTNGPTLVETSYGDVVGVMTVEKDAGGHATPVLTLVRSFVNEDGLEFQSPVFRECDIPDVTRVLLRVAPWFDASKSLFQGYEAEKNELASYACEPVHDWSRRAIAEHQSSDNGLLSRMRDVAKEFRLRRGYRQRSGRTDGLRTRVLT